MPFKQGNKLGAKHKGVKELEGVKQYLEYIATGAARSYFQNVERQFNGEELPEPVKEAMDRFEKNTEFVAPKLARQEIVGKDGKDFSPVLVKFIDGTHDNDTK